MSFPESSCFWFSQIINDPFLYTLVLGKVPGRKYNDWTDGDQVALNGHTPLLSLREHSLSYTQSAIDFSAMNNDIEMLRFIHLKSAPGCTHRALDIASEHGNIKMLKFLHQHVSAEISETGFAMAAWHGHLDCLEYLYDCFCCTSEAETTSEQQVSDFLKTAMDYAVENGQLDCVKFLVSRAESGSYSPGFEQVDYAARGGHLDVLKFLASSMPDRISFTDNALIFAAASGFIGVMEWVHANRHLNKQQDYHLNSEKIAMEKAAKGGHLSCMKWLHEQMNATCTTSVLDQALIGGHLQCVEWILSTAPSLEFTVAAYQQCQRRGHHHLLTWLNSSALKKSCFEWINDLEKELECLENSENDNNKLLFWARNVSPAVEEGKVHNGM